MGGSWHNSGHDQACSQCLCPLSIRPLMSPLSRVRGVSSFELSLHIPLPSILPLYLFIQTTLKCKLQSIGRMQGWLVKCQNGKTARPPEGLEPGLGPIVSSVPAL